MIRSITTTACLTSLLALGAHAQQVDEYTAHYRALYKGRNVGESVFSLQFDSSLESYVFLSSLQAKGLLKLVRPDPVVDRSEFRLDGTQIVPQRFVHEDGSRKGEDNFTIEFDWTRRSATVTGDEFERELPLRDGALDRGSVQVALIQSLARGEQPRAFSIVDDDAVDDYTVAFEGPESVTTGMGEIEVLRYRQQRANSSRYTIIDLAPTLGYVPARIEQIRDGESQSAFVIESIERP